MKYIKLYESIIKKSNLSITNHPLLNLGNEIQNLMISLKELDNFKRFNSRASTVKKYYTTGVNNTIEIYIVYNFYYGRLFEVKINLYDNIVTLMTILHKKYVNRDLSKYNQKSESLFTIFDSNLEEYKKSLNRYYTQSDITINDYEFSIDKLDEITSKIKDFSIYLKSISMYNL